MKFKDQEIKNLSDFIKKLKKNSSKIECPIWYRGHSNKTWKLKPTYLRYSDPPSETTLLQQFKQSATLLLSEHRRLDYEWLFIMQHHGVPTRLLDWSESPLVSLYFACTSEANKRKAGALWCLLPTELNKHASVKPKETYSIPSILDPSLERYNPESYRSEDTTEMGPVAVVSTRNTPRMQSQKGTFTVFHKDKTAIELIADKKHVWRYIIPAAAKTTILEELRILGIDEFSLFPELSSIGQIIKSKIK